MKTRKRTTIGRYLVLVAGCVEPELYGPYPTDQTRVKDARSRRKSDDCIFRLTVVNGRPNVAPFANLEREAE